MLFLFCKVVACRAYSHHKAVIKVDLSLELAGLKPETPTLAGDQGEAREDQEVEEHKEEKGERSCSEKLTSSKEWRNVAQRG